MLRTALVAALLSGSSAFQLPKPKFDFKAPAAALAKLPATATALAISAHAQAAHAKTVLGVNGGLDFGVRCGVSIRGPLGYRTTRPVLTQRCATRDP